MVVLIDPFCAKECVLLQVFLMVIFFSNPFCAKECVLLQVFLIMMILGNPFSAKECVLLQVFLIAMFLISAKECVLLQVFLMAMFCFVLINPFVAKIMCAADAVSSKKSLAHRSIQPEAFIFLALCLFYACMNSQNLSRTLFLADGEMLRHGCHVTP